MFHCIIMWLCHSLFIHSSVSEHLGCFQVCAIMNNIIVNIIIHVSWLHLDFVPRNAILRYRLCESLTFKIMLHSFLRWLYQTNLLFNLSIEFLTFSAHISLVKVLCSSLSNLLLHIQTIFYCCCSFYFFIYLSNQFKHPYIILRNYLPFTEVLSLFVSFA